MAADAGPGPYAQYEQLYPDPEAGPYLLRLTIEDVDKRLEIVGIEMWGQQPPVGEAAPWGIESPADTPQRITSTAIRLPLDKLAMAALEGMGHVTSHAARPVPRGGDTKSKGGRPPRSPEHWNKVAKIYSAALASGKRPTSTVATQLDVSKTTAAKWVARCRAQGLLPATTKGRAVGTPPPTEAAYEALAGARDEEDEQYGQAMRGRRRGGED